MQTELEKYLETIPLLYRPLAKRALTGKLGKAPSVKAKCQECVNYEDVKLRVSSCTVWKCPLWRVRPYQKGKALAQDAPSAPPDPSSEGS